MTPRLYISSLVSKSASKSIESLLVDKNNNFTLIRLIASLLVLLSHCFYLKGFNTDPLVQLSKTLSLGTLAVYFFFITSGFLITKSWFRINNVLQYLRNRALRIFPALIVSVLFCAFVVGPVVTNLPVKEYFQNNGTYNFLINSTLWKIVYYLPCSFLANPYPGAVNGSYWTLPMEFFLYIIVAVLGVFSILKRRKIMVALIVILLLTDFYLTAKFASSSFGLINMDLKKLLICGIYFIAGSLIYLYKDKLIVTKALTLLLLVAYLISLFTPWSRYLGYLFLPYLTISLALVDIPIIKKYPRSHDLSYGVYLYAFPVQQTLVHFFGGNINIILLFVFATAISLALAALSWRFIEKPSLRYKF